MKWLLALYALSAVGVALQRTLLSTENNFLIYRAAFRHLVAGQDLYAAYPAVHGDLFKYSPTFALLFAPFALLPLVPGYILWALCSAMAVPAGISRVLPPRQAGVALAIAWLGVVGDMQRAQSNALCAGLMLVGWACYEQRRQLVAAAAVAAGAFVKIFPLAALAGALMHPRRLRFAALFAMTMLVGIALPLLVTSPSALAMQYQSWHAIEALDTAPLSQYGTSGAGLYGGLMGLVRAWFGVQWPHWPVQLIGVVLLITPLILRRDRWGEPLFRVKAAASVLVFCVLFNHQAESPSYVIAMIGTAVWFASAGRTWWRVALMALAFVVVDVGSTDLMPRVWYREFYVAWMLKTVPLIPVWAVMQLELFGLVRDEGVEGNRRSETT
ncbi:MAG TPA: glycosyltransferase family 87 protein [Gemmatimonadaceae bacterium]|nr:glycosyltransferase family 87 protein [Gemmatimonadaceae bacterium]